MQREETANSESTSYIPAPARRRGALSAMASRGVLASLSMLQRGRLTVTLPDGAQTTIAGREDPEGPHGIVDIHDMGVFRRLLRSGDIGFAEGFMAGDFTTPDLTELLHLAVANEAAFDAYFEGTWIARLARRWSHRRRKNTKTGSRRNIAHHYDLGNAFYERWLDPGMTYSAALFGDDRTGGLDLAQSAKYEALCADLGLGPDHTVLEIGCGWGAFAEHAAASRGCRVHAVTISREQFDHTRRRVHEAGLAERVEVEFRDYRDIEGRFDAVASIEMFEAVGTEHWRSYFSTVFNRLKQGGQAALQVITIDEDRFEAYRANPDFIQRYIFPGGMLPSHERFLAAARAAGLTAAGTRRFGRDYAETLRRWAERFERAWPEIQDLGFDERFRRMWRYYLSYCEVGFDTGRIDVEHFLLTRP
jgi:cyclopropane-fatty-acyl-phospholipid synthase